MFPRAHFHDGTLHDLGRRDLFSEYGSSQAIDMAVTFRDTNYTTNDGEESFYSRSSDGVKKLNTVSQQSRLEIRTETSLSASAPCLPLLPPVFGESTSFVHVHTYVIARYVIICKISSVE